MQKLLFRTARSYRGQDAIRLPARLVSGTEQTDVLASVDTGCSHCIFERQHGELLDLRIEEGEPKQFLTATGAVATFGHVVSIETLGIEFESMVYFFADEHISKNLLGRTGWLDRVRLGVVDYDQQLYLAEYDYDGE